MESAGLTGLFGPILKVAGFPLLGLFVMGFRKGNMWHAAAGLGFFIMNTVALVNLKLTSAPMTMEDQITACSDASHMRWHLVGHINTLLALTLVSWTVPGPWPELSQPLVLFPGIEVQLV